MFQPMKPGARPRRLLIRLALAIALSLAGWPAVFAATPPTAMEVLTFLEVKPEQVKSLDRGEIIEQAMTEASDKELALDVALYLKAPPTKVAGYLRKGYLDAVDPDVIAQKEFPPDAGPEVFKSFNLATRPSEEIEDLLNAEPGERFNLSAEEIAGFNALREKLEGADKKVQLHEVSQLYREMLWRRFQAYRKNGLAGVATYAHEEGRAPADPGSELRAATQNDLVLSRFYPGIHQAWLRYPADMPAQAEEQFFWLDRKVEGRPTAILGQRIFQENETGSVVAIRHFYAGHSYNSLTLLIGCLPYREGSIVFYTQRISTDQVAGAASELRHVIGRGQMRNHMILRLEALRKAVNG